MGLSSARSVALMHPDFSPEPTAYLYVAMAEHIAARIERGELPPGGRLPGERDLAAEYGVAVPTARRAVEVLRKQGLVVTVPVKGTFVTKPAD